MCGTDIPLVQETRVHTRNPQVHGPGHMQPPPPKPAGPRATVLRRPRESGLGVARGPGSQGGGRLGGPGVGRGEVGGIPSPCQAGCDEGSLGLVILLSLTLGYFEQEITGDYDRHCRGATLPGWASLTPGPTAPRAPECTSHQRSGPLGSPGDIGHSVHQVVCVWVWGRERGGSGCGPLA